MSDPTVTSNSNPTVNLSNSLDAAYKHLNLVPNPDGTITRLNVFPNIPATCDLKLPTPVLSKDIRINQSNNTWVRIYLPRDVLDHPSSTPPSKLPLVVYYHGGGFVILSAASTMFHNFCVDFATDLHVIVASVDYRLAPEHRLPAAYDDALEALHWIKNSPHDWLRNHADLSNSYLMGPSAGGNIACHVALRVGPHVEQLHPLKIRGMILQQPFFGGTQRSISELRLANVWRFPLSSADLMWELSLPEGFDRDHEYCNPRAMEVSKKLDEMKAVGWWRVLVTGYDGDLLVDRQIELVKMMEEKGVNVVGHFAEGGYHGVDVVEEAQKKALFAVVKTFIFSSNSEC